MTGTKNRLRKLTAFRIGQDVEYRRMAALEMWLDNHAIYYRRAVTGSGEAQYFVQTSDLCCAQAVLPAIMGIASR